MWEKATGWKHDRHSQKHDGQSWTWKDTATASGLHNLQSYSTQTAVALWWAAKPQKMWVQGEKGRLLRPPHLTKAWLLMLWILSQKQSPWKCSVLEKAAPSVKLKLKQKQKASTHGYWETVNLMSQPPSKESKTNIFIQNMSFYSQMFPEEKYERCTWVRRNWF